ncbi:MAG: AglZ/HisF2 family acetamidino modification protein [Bacteroidota bacterium]|nr:AglZ/HisF2 family acetamidino modification protein [Bacteroidota bacterium]
MFRPRVIPVLLLKGQGLVKTVQFSNPTYIGDPINAVRIFNDLEADELIFLDITASNEKRLASVEVIKKISDEAFMPFAVGGGIKTIEDVHALIMAGAEKVVINSSSVNSSSLITQAADIFGSQSIIVSIDVKKTFWGKTQVFINSGKKSTGLNPVEHAKNMEKAGAGEIFITSIDLDGTMQGYDIELIKSVSESVGVPVVAGGGAGTMEHFKEAVIKGHATAVAAGSMFVYHGPRKGVLINYPEKKELKKLFQSSLE